MNTNEFYKICIFEVLEGRIGVIPESWCLMRETPWGRVWEADIEGVQGSTVEGGQVVFLVTRHFGMSGPEDQAPGASSPPPIPLPAHGSTGRLRPACQFPS